MSGAAQAPGEPFGHPRRYGSAYGRRASPRCCLLDPTTIYMTVQGQFRTARVRMPLRSTQGPARGGQPPLATLVAAELPQNFRPTGQAAMFVVVSDELPHRRSAAHRVLARARPWAPAQPPRRSTPHSDAFEPVPGSLPRQHSWEGASADADGVAQCAEPWNVDGRNVSRGQCHVHLRHDPGASREDTNP